MPSTFGIVSHGAVTDTWDPTATDGNRAELGTIYAYRNSDQWSLVQAVQLDNNGCSQGEVLVINMATLKQYSVTKASTTDRGGIPAGVACATIASQRCGFMYIGGYVEKADISQTTASGEYLMIGGSTAGKLTNDIASAFNSGTQGNTSMFLIVGRARAAFATGIGSITLSPVWGV